MEVCSGKKINFNKMRIRKNDGLMSELTNYIKKNLKKGYTKESLKWALINQGYSRIEVAKALKRVDMELAEKAPNLESRPEIKYQIVEPKEYAKTVYKSKRKKSFWHKILGHF